MSKKFEIPKEELKELYIMHGKSSLEIGRIYNVHKSVILRRLKEYGIERRKPYDHMSGRTGERNFMYGKQHSDDSKNAMREKKCGKNNSMYGVSHTNESRQKMSDSLRKHKFGDKKIEKGYCIVYIPYKNGNRGKWIYEHRFIMEKAIGRKLKRSEIVHHIDGNKLNNNIDNLELLPNIAEHNRRHKNLSSMK